MRVGIIGAGNVGGTLGKAWARAGDDAALKPKVMGLVSDLGFQAMDAGPLSASRLLEQFAMLWIHMVLKQNAASDSAFAFLARGQ